MMLRVSVKRWVWLYTTTYTHTNSLTINHLHSWSDYPFTHQDLKLSNDNMEYRLTPTSQHQNHIVHELTNYYNALASRVS